MTRTRSRWHRPGRAPEDGNAIVEFVFVALLVLVPLVYLVVAVAVIQRSRLATTNAARDVGRAVATAASATDADLRSQVALRVAVTNQGLSPADVDIRYVAASSDCQQGDGVQPSLTPGSEFAVCVIHHQPLPAIPAVLSGRGITTIGRYVVHVDEFRAAQP